MMQLTLNDTAKVREKLAAFEKFLKAYDLQLLDCLESLREGTIELSIRVNFYQAARLVSDLAYEFFEDELIASRTDYFTNYIQSIPRAA